MGPFSDRLFPMVNREVQQVIDDQSGMARPLLLMTVGDRRYQAMKHAVAEQVMARLPQTMSYVEHYAQEAMDLERLLGAKMDELSAEEFEGLLRPAFRQDEWILITVGALLGFLVGELQVLGMELLAQPVPGFDHQALLQLLRPLLS